MSYKISFSKELKMIEQETYTAKNIDVLEGLEGIRRKPGVYVGDINKTALFQIIKEAVDNGIDEHLLGGNPKIFIQLNRSNMSVLVADCGRGIPVETHPKTGISTLTTILTKIHAGGKFSGKSISIGTHGVGISATNALSSIFEVWTYRADDFQEDQSSAPKRWYHQSFAQGIPTCEVTVDKVPPPIKWKCGTVVRFTPDPTIFKKNYRLPARKLIEWLTDIKYLCPNLEFTLDVDGKETVYVTKTGLVQWASETVEKKNLVCVGKRFEFSNETLQVVLQWTNIDEEYIHTYVNCCRTISHGSHFTGFRKALSGAIAPFSEEKYNAEDLRIGLVGILHYKMKEPTYDTQTKERLSCEEAALEIKTDLTPVLTDFFHKNKSLTDTILTKAIKLRQARIKFKQNRAAIKDISLVSKHAKNVLPEFLLGAPRCKPALRELYICEGKSAQGTLKNARDPKYQEILPLKGKFTNAAKYPAAKVFENNDIKNIFVSIGSNQNVKNLTICNPKHARVGKVILLPDEDDDGKHIGCLALTLILTYMKPLIEAGMLYVVNAPLYITSHKDQKYYGNTLQDIRQQLPKNAKVFITRMKGWGECLGFQVLTPTNQGLLKMGDLVNQKTQALVASPFGNKIPSKFFKTEPRNLRKIATKEGYTLEGTEDQEVIVLNKSGHLEWKELKNLTTLDYVAIDRHVNLWATATPDFKDYVQKKNSPVQLPVKMTKELARLLGYFIGDGWYGVCFGTKEEAKDDFMYCAKKCFPDNKFKVVDLGLSKKGKPKFSARVNGKKDLHVTRSRATVLDFLDFLGIKRNCTSYTKEIPWCILQAPKEYVIEFLKALFECDGYAHPVLTEYYTASPLLANQLKSLLLNLGIITGGFTKKGRYNPFTDKFNKNIYACKLLIGGSRLDTFFNTVGFISKAKNSKYIYRKRNTNTDIIPYTKTAIQDLIFKHRIKGGYYKVKGKELRLRIAGHTGAANFTYNYLKNHSYIIQDIRELDFKLADALQFCLNKEPYWSQIKENKSTEEKNKAYDITMPESESFIGNGMICHNCPASDMKAIAMNPETRVLYQVTLSDQCEDRVEEIMGKDGIYRKKLLGI